MSERYLEDYVVGQKFGSGRIRVEKDRIKALCRLIRPAAFHLDKALASGTVFRRTRGKRLAHRGDVHATSGWRRAEAGGRHRRHGT